MARSKLKAATPPPVAASSPASRDLPLLLGLALAIILVVAALHPAVAPCVTTKTASGWPAATAAGCYVWPQSPWALPDGGDLYSHYVEAEAVADLIRDRSSSFWFEHISHGYPLFTAYMPLPSILSAAAISLAPSGRGGSVFSAITAVVVSVVPLFYYLGGRAGGRSRLQCLLMAMAATLMGSWVSGRLCPRPCSRPLATPQPNPHPARPQVDYADVDKLQANGMLSCYIGVSALPIVVGVASPFGPRSATRGTTAGVVRNVVLPACCLALSALTQVHTLLHALLFLACELVVHSLSTAISLERRVRAVGEFVGAVFGCVVLVAWLALALFETGAYVGDTPTQPARRMGYTVAELGKRWYDGDVIERYACPRR